MDYRIRTESEHTVMYGVGIFLIWTVPLLALVLWAFRDPKKLRDCFRVAWGVFCTAVMED